MDQFLHAVYMQVSYILHCWIIENISSQTMKNSFSHDVLLINLIYSDLKSPTFHYGVEDTFRQ